jgi:hypothetical protein
MYVRPLISNCTLSDSDQCPHSNLLISFLDVITTVQERSYLGRSTNTFKGGGILVYLTNRVVLIATYSPYLFHSSLQFKINTNNQIKSNPSR